MKGKPIEPGCLALIVKARVNPENLGRVVRVLYQPAPLEPLPDGVQKLTPWKKRTWFVEALPGHPDLMRALVGKHSRTLMRREPARSLGVLETSLIRLDDDEEPKTVSTAHTKDLFEVPEELTCPK